MNNTHYIGRRVSSFELYDELGPITGVSLLLDDESEPINVGDDTGYVLEVSCPYGTETMAQNILSTVQGRTYKGFRAENAILDPLAELGDHLSINGSTFLLAHRIAKFGPGHMSEISAPGENELEHEYGWVSPEKKEFNRKVSGLRSEIAKNSKEISLRITDDQAQTLIKQTLNAITLSVDSTDGVTSISLTGEGVSVKAEKLELSVKAAKIEGTLEVDQINMKGAITWSHLSEGCKNHIGDGLTEDDVYTYIDNQLVASPTIAGGVFMDYDQEVSLYLDKAGNTGEYGMILEDNAGDEIFSVWDSGAETVALSAKGFGFLSIVGDHVYALGTWDFSSAEVIWD